MSYVIVGLLAVFVFVTSVVVQPVQTAQAATLNTLNFQARLQNNPGGGIVPDGYYNVEFKLYNTSTSSGSSQGSCTGDANCLWTETRYDSNGVTAGNDNRVRVSKGYLTVNLGSISSFPAINWDQSLYITMNIGGSTQTATPTWNGEMSPRLALTAVPYAFRAGQLAQFGGTYTSTLSITNPTGGNQSFILPNMNVGGSWELLTEASGLRLQSTSPGTQQTGNFNISGTGIAGTFQAAAFDRTNTGTLSIGATNASDVTVGSTGTTGTLTLGQSTASNTIAIGNANTANGDTQTINIGAGTPAGTGKAVLTLGNTANASSAAINAGTGNITLSTKNASGGTVVQSVTSNSQTAFDVQNASGDSILAVDTSNSSVHIAGASPLVFQGATDDVSATTIDVTDPTGTNTIVLPDASGTFAVSAIGNIALNSAGQLSLTGQIPVANGGTGASTLTSNGVLYGNGTSAVGVTAAGTTGQCLKATTSSAPTWGTCGVGSASTMQDTYDNSAGTNPQIQLSNTHGGLKIRDNATPVSGNLLQVQNSAGSATYFGLSTTGMTLQDSSGNNALVFDSSGDSHLRLYANGASPTLYADLYYDTTNSRAVFAASSGTTAVGNGSGDINLLLTGVSDVVNGTKTATIAGSYSLSDFNFTQTLTGGANNISGAVMNVVSNSTTSGTNSQNTLQITQTNNTTGNVLSINQQNGSGGNLIRAVTGGSTEKFKVSNAGTVTIASGQSYTGAGAVTLSSAAATALTVTGNAASTVSTTAGALTLTSAAAATWSTSAGALTLTSAAAATWGTSAGALTLAGAAGVIITGGSGNVQIGSSTTDATATLTILDSYNNATDPTGVAGAMYYNTALGKFRCYQGSWSDCLGINPDYQRKRPFYSSDFLDTGNVAAGYWQSGSLANGGTGGALGALGSTTGTADHPGVVVPNAANSAAVGSGHRFGASNAQSITGGENYEVIFNLSTVSSVQFRFGFIDTGSTSGAVVDGAWVDIANATLSGKTSATSTTSTTGTTYTVSASTWYRIRLIVNSGATTVSYYLYDMSGTQLWTNTLSTNIPTGAAEVTGSGATAWSTNTTGRDLYMMDYMAQWWDKNLVR